MAIIAVRKRQPKLVPASHLRSKAVFLVASLLLGGTGKEAMADTIGGLTSPSIGVPGYATPWAYDTNNPPVWGWIQNEYLLVSVGYLRSFTPTNTQVPGRISIGTTGGSLRTTLDDNQPLVGWITKSGTNVLDGAQWPYGWGIGPGNWGMYLRALVDAGVTGGTGTSAGTQVNVGFDSNQWTLAPVFRPIDSDGVAGPVLVGDSGTGTTGLHIRWEIKLHRGMARFKWTIINDDATPHTVALRLASNIRSRGDLYYQDPNRGTSQFTQVFGADPSAPGALTTAIPQELSIFRKRADTGTDIPFHHKQIFSGRDSTPPTTVYVANSDEFAPGDTTPAGQYLPLAPGVRVPFFESGLAVVSYWGGATGFALAPGQRRTVITYVGSGGTTELDQADFIVGTDSIDTLPYSAEAATLPEVRGNTAPTMDLARYFISEIGNDTTDPTKRVPKPFSIYASVYSQKLRDPLTDVPLSGVYASLTLPQGLRFAIDPSTGKRDVATKLVVPVGSASGAAGEVKGDQDARTSWLVEPTGEVFGPVTYQVAVGVAKPNPLSRSLSRTINIPAVPLRELATGAFQMIGFPFQFDPVLTNNGDPDTIINSLSGGLPKQTTLFKWVPDPLSLSGTAGRYEIAKKLEPGTGYFYNPGNGIQPLIFLKGAQPVPLQAPTGNTTPVPLQMVLERGWNMVSNPYVYEIPLNYLRIVPLENNPGLDSLSFGDAVRNGLIKGSIFYFSPAEGGYRLLNGLTESLKPWQAYWIFTNARISVLFANPTIRGSVVIPDPSPDPGDPAEPPTRAMKQMTAENWTLPLIARRTDGKLDAATFIGVAPGAKEGASQIDIPKPPPFQDYVYVGLTRGEGTGRFAQILKPAGGRQTWDLVVESDKAGTANLLWPGVMSLPRRVRLQITDLQTGTTRDIRSTSGIKVILQKGTPSRFQIIATTEATRPLAITNLHATGGTRRGTGTYGLAFNLTQAATINATVKTITGRTVSVLAVGRAAGTTETRLAWNGLSQQGAPVPAGSYVVEVTAMAEDGTRVSQRVPISVLR